MYLKRVLVTILIVVSSTLAATTTNFWPTTGESTNSNELAKTTPTSTSNDGISFKLGENSAANNTEDEAIEPHFGSIEIPEGLCQCVTFYSCHPTDVVTTGDLCESNEVCCRLSNLSDEIEIPSTIPDSTQQPPYVDPNSIQKQRKPTSESQGEKCGMRRSSVQNRTSDSEYFAKASFGEFPWMALILTTKISSDAAVIKNVFVCGASLLSPSIVLTAAYCVAKFSADQLIIRVGEYNTQSDNEPMPHQNRAVFKIVIHPEFNDIELYNDMALLKVTRDFDLAPHIAPICLPFTNSQFADPTSYDPTDCLATGWGKYVHDRGNFQTILKRVDLALINQNECEDRLRNTELGEQFKLNPSSICTRGKSGFDTCEGDGGGPLVCASYENINRYVQVGIVSWRVGTCYSDVPKVYASLYANSEWLTKEYNAMSELQINSGSLQNFFSTSNLFLF